MNKRIGIAAVAAVAAVLVIAVAFSGFTLNLKSQAAPTKTVVENARDDGNFTQLVDALNSTGLIDALNGTGPFTVFAPTDEAFDALNESAGNLTLDRENLTQILQYHVVAGDVMSQDLQNGMTLTSLTGQDLTVIANESGTYINNAKVISADIDSSNGVIHAIDSVMVPRNIVQTAENTSDLSTLYDALDRTNLTDTLNGTGPFTVFAPTNAAFEALDEELKALLQADDEANLSQVRELLLAHVVPAKIVDGNGTENQTLTSVNGQKIVFKTNETGVFVNNVEVAMSNVVCTNGVVYVIPEVLTPLKTVNETLAEMADLSSLYGALESVNLTETLNGTGPFTVFAPSNAAFEALGDDAPTDEDNLTRVLLYHVLSGEVYSWQLQNGTVATLNGQQVNVTVNETEDGTIWMIGNATVITSDIVCSNGVIHVIDAVLLPPDMEAEVPGMPAPTAPQQPAPTPTPQQPVPVC